jgi:solute carrier family 25 protein 38
MSLPASPTPLELAFKRFLYGACGATLVAGLTQPLDVVKTTQQSARMASAASQGVLATLSRIHATSGLLSLWSGLSPTVLRVFFGAGLYFSTLHSLQDALQPRLGSASAFSSGLLARMLTAGIMSPISVVKTRMENLARVGQPPAATASSSTLGMLGALARGEGVATLYTGLLPTLLRDAPYSGLYFTAFTSLKGALGIGGTEAAPGTPAWVLPLKTFAAGLCAGAIATTLTHPADVLKTRLQLQPPPLGRGAAVGRVLLGEAARVLREEGVPGLFTGLQARVLKKATSTAFTWTIFEQGMRSTGGGGAS